MELGNDRMLSLLEAGVKHRQQSLTLLTTNRSGSEDSFCEREHMYACGVAEGKIDDPSYLPAVFTNSTEDDCLNDESQWIKSNPSLPDIPGYEYLRGEVRRAKNLSGSMRAQVLRLNFSVGSVDSGTWIKAADWKEVEVDDLSDTIAPKTYLALDLSATTDLTAMALVHDYEDHLEAEVLSWIPASNLERLQQHDKQMYDLFVEAGYLRLSGTKTIDYRDIADSISLALQTYNVVAVAFDAWGMRRIRELLDDYGIQYEEDDHTNRAKLLLLSHPQGFTSKADPDRRRIHLAMPRSISRTEEAILNNEVMVLKNPLLRIAMLATVPVVDGSMNRRLMKNRTRVRIDPAIALVMGIGTAREFRATGRRVITDINTLFRG